MLLFRIEFKMNRCVRLSIFFSSFDLSVAIAVCLKKRKEAIISVNDATSSLIGNTKFLSHSLVRQLQANGQVEISHNYLFDSGYFNIFNSSIEREIQFVYSRFETTNEFHSNSCLYSHPKNSRFRIRTSHCSTTFISISIELSMSNESISHETSECQITM